MKKGLLLMVCSVIFLATPFSVFAKSTYVLPYPSVMPGGVQYKLHVLWEEVSKYWYFGDFGQFKYNLKESDKYLVEAKTLFDYEQYLLGVRALKKSDEFFEKAPAYLERAKQNKKNIDDKQHELKIAAEKHREVLEYMKRVLPQNVHWQPEKDAASDLPLYELLDNSMKIRQI